MRRFPTPLDTPPRKSAGTTIRLADYQTQPPTRTSWNEVQIQREEIRLPQSPRDERR